MSGWAAWKCRQAGDQPAHGDGDVDLDVELAGSTGAGDEGGALGDALEGVAQEGVVEQPGLGEGDPAGLAPEEGDAEALLEVGDLVADGRLGDGQLLGGGPEAQMAGGRLEGPQRGEGWQGHT